MTYDLATQTIDTSALSKNDIINCSYSGAAKSITLPAGKYKLECWGGEGGARGLFSYGGKGGYSVGTLTLNSPTQVYVYAGGGGKSTAGGFNGGGSRNSYNGGGGGSDIRLRTDSLYSRVIVAGGGGSDGGSGYSGGYGGGTSGGTSTSGSGTGGGGGTQTSGGVGGTGKTNSGTFGQGGQGLSATRGYGGAGGGGWYGGGGSYPSGTRDNIKGGGGGSGYVYNSSTAADYPSGCTLISDDYLTDSNTIAGNSNIIDYSGSTTTGHAGDGACRISVIEVSAGIPIKLGNKSIQAIYLGNKEIKGLYLGNKKIF